MEKREQLSVAIKEALMRNKTKDEWLSRVAESAIKCDECPAKKFCNEAVGETVHGCSATFYAWLKEE